ncbi:MAG: hypothetical protein V3T86_12105 [Planctomycetota bacterium]
MPIFAVSGQQFAGYLCITIGIWVVLFGLRLNRRQVDKNAAVPESVRTAVKDEISSGAASGEGPGES